MPMMTPNQSRSTSILTATGVRTGITMNAISNTSINMPNTNTNAQTAIKKPVCPPGNCLKRASTHSCPSAALNAKENTVAPIRMNSTKTVSLAVESTACVNSGRLSRLLATPITNAPTAPIAPPSVGVAMPRKIVPSTRKMRTIGGIITNVTCFARRESQFSLSHRSTQASR